MDICPLECDDGAFWRQQAHARVCVCGAKRISKPKHKLTYFPIEHQLKLIRDNPTLKPYLELRDRHRPTYRVDDIQHSQMFLDMIKSGVGDGTIVLGIHADGVPLAKGKRGANKNSIWLISAEILNLPAHLRVRPENQLLLPSPPSPDKRCV